MNPEQFRAKYPLILNWIRQTLAAHAPKARPVASLGFTRLPLFFSPTTLASAKVVGVNVVPLPPLTDIGLSRFADFEKMNASGITYFDTFFLRNDLSEEDYVVVDERLHFHELVHVIQWSLLGPERFLAMYADGLERFGYRDSPLEEMAYRLDNQFQRGVAVFSVEQVVGRELKLLAAV